MSSQFGLVRMAGKLFVIDKTPHETDERLQDRAWFCAHKNATDDQTISESHMWVNKKYFDMKYKDGY